MLGALFRKHSNEEQLVSRVKDGDMVAARRLYDENVRYLSAICARYIQNDEDVKDVMQEAFATIFSKTASFEYRGEGSLRAWMARIVLNESLRHLKRSTRLTFTELDTGSVSIPDEVATDGIPADVIHRMIRELPDGYRTVFNLYVIEEKSHKEIAALLGIKPDTSASQLHKAKTMLYKKLIKYKNDNSL